MCVLIHLVILFLSSWNVFAALCVKLKPVKNIELSQIGASAPGSGKCVSDRCPKLSRRNFNSLPYADVNGGVFRGSFFKSIGYSEDLTSIQNSDLREVHITTLLAVNLSGSDLQGALVESISGYANLTNSNLKGTTIRQIDDLESVTLEGAIYDSASKLPFSDFTASRKGMIKK